jgi:hypothetical protein
MEAQAGVPHRNGRLERHGNRRSHAPIMLIST